MTKTRPKELKPRYHFRHWRKFRGHTQEGLADLAGVSAPGISQLENGKQGFSDETLASLAGALDCEPGDLLLWNPLDQDSVWSIWSNIPSEKRALALKVLKPFADPPKPAHNARRRPGNGKAAPKHN